MQAIKTQDQRSYNRHLVKTFSVVNATAGTGIAEAVKTSFAATAALAILRNAGASGLVRPRSLRLINTVAPASGTAMHMRIAVDTGATRYTSGATSITGKNRDMSSSVTPNATFKAGALVVAAASASVRYIAQLTPMTVIPVVGDNLVILFGQDDASAAGMGTIAGTTGRQVVVNVGPVVLGPSQEIIIHTWYPSNASTAAEWEMTGLWEESRK